MNGENHKQALPPGFRLGSYLVVRVLGVGGFGVTYLCEHTGLGHRVAVKEYLPNEFAVREGATVHPKSASDRESFEWGLSRFVDEARTLTRFRHPNLVRVSDYFEANNTAYIVMDYEDGEPLDVLLKRHGTLTEAQLKRVLLPVADGLRLVHAAGFLHRDIKPSNIFVRRADESPVLLDFGSARQALGRKSRSMTAIASAGYSPPEQYESQGVQGPWTDIYALSALCHRVITGETPMEAPRRQSQLLRSQADPLPKLAEAGVAGYSPAFLEAVDRGLRVIETERPQILDDWLAWMDDAASVGPATPPKSATRPKRGKAAGKRADGPMPPEASAHPRAPKSSGFNAKVGVLAGAAAAVIGVGLYFALVDWMQGAGRDQAPPPASGLDANPVGGGSSLLVVETRPVGVEVLIEGRSVGETPLELTNLRAGAYDLRLRHPHYETVELERQRLRDGEVLRVERTLKRGVGKLTVLTTPRNAWVEREGKRLASRTPVTLEGLPAGPLELTLGAGGHRTARVRTEVPKDGLGQLEYGLERIAYGTLTLELVPADATVTLPDIGSPYSTGMRLPEGRYRVIASREGYVQTTQEVAVPGNGEARERIELSPLPQPFTVVATPPEANVEILGIAEAYRAGMPLTPGDYRVRVSAAGYRSKTDRVRHGASRPTIRRIELERQFAAGNRFRDCAECPEMVVVPAGSFQMGSPSHEQYRGEDEGPVHRVTIARPFAAGVYEVKFAEWDACASSGGCGERRPSDNGWGRGQHPVINVSWDDAKSYVQWLSSRTGERYRLLSESEWEYMARAKTRTPFHTGGTISTDQANYDGNFVYGSGRKGVYRRKTVPVGSFPPSAWGLHDVHGNVWEWVEDCWNGSYAGAPTDGGAWERRDCSVHVLRGGSWNTTTRFLRSAYRGGGSTGIRIDNIGFRVARTLTP